MVQADEYGYTVAITGPSTLSVGAGTGSDCSSTKEGRFTVAVGNYWCSDASNKRPTLDFTLTASPVDGSPPINSNNVVRVVVAISGASNKGTLDWQGKLKLSPSPTGGNHYMIKMNRTTPPLTTKIKLVNRKRAGKPPKGTLTIKVIQHCYTNRGVTRCSKGKSGSYILTTTVN